MRVFINKLEHAPHANAGEVLDLPDAEAQALIARGAAVPAPVEPPAAAANEPTPSNPEPTPANEPDDDADDEKAKRPPHHRKR